MPIAHFTVTQVKTAAACPRILYFDAERTRGRNLKQPAVTRIWKAGKDDEATACGSLFHAAIEQFNRHAAADPAVRQLVESGLDSPRLTSALLGHVYDHHVNHEVLFQKPGAQQQAFLAALRCYVGELADILVHARSEGRLPDEVLDQLFGDRRRRVDVTFAVGRTGEPVHVTGILDYVFYDWRSAGNRVVDYKLTPADKPSDDLFQVSLYALMHHVQHRTEPGAGVLYLHPKRQMVEKSWERIHAERGTAFDLLASMREWVRYDEKSGQGLKPPGEPLYCAVCRWKDECVQRLGPKHEGQRLDHWSQSRAGPAREPRIDARIPVAGEDPPEPAGPDATPAAAVEALSEDALWIGERGESQGPVSLPLSVLPTHVAVVGAAGSGKTWTAKVLAEEAIVQQVPVLALDPQGDLVQLMKRRDPGVFRGFGRWRYERFWQRVEPRILTPGTSHGSRLCLSPIRLPCESDLADLPVERRREEIEGLLSSIAGNLVNLARVGGDADCQLAFLLQVLRRLAAGAADRAVGLAEVVAGVSEPESAGLEEADRFIRKTEREKLARKLFALLHGPSANLFTGGVPLDLDTLLRPREEGKAPLNVVYLNALADDDQKQFFVAALAAEVYRWMVTTGSAGSRPRLFFFVDEARDYLPAGARKPPAKEPLLRLFAQGRKYGVACLICTQSPRSVDYQVFTNCSTKVIGRLESAQDVERVADWFRTESAPPWLNGRKGAAMGTLVARWPGMPPELEGRIWKSRMLFSMHEGAWSPERVEQETRASALPT